MTGDHDSAVSRVVLYAVTDPITALSFLRGQLAFLKADGFEVHLACGSSPDLQRLADEEGVVFHEVPLSRTWRIGDAVRAVRQASKILASVRPHVLNYSTPKASLVWAIASWSRRPPMVIYLLRGLRLEGERPRSLAFLLLWLTELVACRSADGVVCVSHELRRNAIKLRLVRQGRAVILGSGSSNGVDAGRFSHAAQYRTAMRDDLGYSPRDIVVGFVGRLTRDKGIYDLLAAVAGLDDRICLLLIGGTEPDVDLSELLESHAVQGNRLRHVEHTNAAERYYSAMDIFVLPSYREGMSNALLEAQAAGLACVTTVATGCRDAVVRGVTAEVVPMGEPAALAKAIEWLAEDEDRRRDYGAQGQAWVRRQFQSHDQWQRYAELYRGLGPIKRNRTKDAA